jgi:hypothetical protein
MTNNADNNDHDKISVRDEQIVFLGAWLDQRKEKDKAIFFSAIGVIGFDVVILLGENSIAIACLFCLSLSSAALSAALMLLVFHMNTKYLGTQISDRNAPSNDKCLGVVDVSAMLSFLASLLFIGLVILFHLMHGGIMSTKFEHSDALAKSVNNVPRASSRDGEITPSEKKTGGDAAPPESTGDKTGKKDEREKQNP